MWGRVIARVLAGTLGAYGTSYALAGALAVILPLSRVDRVSAATSVSFLIMAACSLWAGCAHRLVWVWGVMVGVMAVSGLVVLCGHITP